MDTREKIVDLAELPALLRNLPWSVSVGFFDPLTLTQAERLAAAGSNLLAIVDPGENSLLGAPARAILVAALRQVNLVVIATRREWQPLLAQFPNVQVDDNESADRARSSQFAGYILRRQAS